MGRAARNHGGTGGHGCVPLPGERPNYNRHVMTDKTLLSLLSNNERKKLLGTGERQTDQCQQKSSDAQLPKDDGLKNPLTSAKKPGNSAKQPLTSVKQHMAFAKQSVSSANQPVTSAKQPVTSADQQMTSAIKPVSSAMQPVTSAKHQVPSAKHPMKWAKQPLTSANLAESREQRAVNGPS